MHTHEHPATTFRIVVDETFDCPAGSFIFVPAGIRHGFRVGDAASRKLNLYTPAAMAGTSMT